MKKLLLGLTLLSLTSISFAGGAMKSIALEGEYSLVSAEGEYAERYKCPEEIKVTVDKDFVHLKQAEGSDVIASKTFFTKNEGCESTEGDIGPLRVTCTNFNKKSVSHTITSHLTIAGLFISEVRELKVSNDVLSYSQSNVNFPLGIIGIGDRDEFDCEYQRN